MFQHNNNGGGHQYNTNTTNQQQSQAEEEEEDNDVEGLEAWERAYADERSWESLQEDESGLLRPIDNKTIQHAQYRRRLRTYSSSARIQKGLIRFLYIVIDLSRVHLLFCLDKLMNYSSR